MVYFKVLPSTRIELSPLRPWLAPPCRLSAQPSVVQFKDENPFSHSRAPSLASLPAKPHRMIDLDKLSSELELKSSLYTFYMKRIKHQWSSDSSVSSERLGREHLPNLSSSLHTAT